MAAYRRTLRRVVPPRGGGLTREGSAPLVDQADNLTRIGEAIELLPGEDQLAVVADFKEAAAHRLEVQVFDLAPVGAY